ncbi:hypothetical protein PoB_002679800 [Plakobranchus ocellatus]|uniref:Uncharacterized protein n=1 Tax=Plakobranchus ocellatus TaxID=259542 RepID=A0AAV3ZZH7_9GAST|nr:hypothetical protein PoB_002679800 [Plakobranchus ocellatus]
MHLPEQGPDKGPRHRPTKELHKDFKSFLLASRFTPRFLAFLSRCRPNNGRTVYSSSNDSLPLPSFYCRILISTDSGISVFINLCPFVWCRG